MLALVAVAAIAVFMGMRLPTGFIPQEDQGYMFVAMQLPDAASLQRTDAAALRVTDALRKTPGIGGVVQVNGFSLLTQTQSTNTASSLSLSNHGRNVSRKRNKSKRSRPACNASLAG